MNLPNITQNYVRLINVSKNIIIILICRLLLVNMVFLLYKS